MAKIRHKKRVMPANGRMSQGAYRPDYWDGLDAGEAAKRGKLDRLPLCDKSEGCVVLSELPSYLMDASEGAAFVVTQVDDDESYLMPRQRSDQKRVTINAKIWRSERHSQEEVRRYWAERETRGDVLAHLRAQESERQHAYRGVWLTRSKEFWDGVTKTEAPKRSAMGTLFRNDRPEVRERKLGQSEGEIKRAAPETQAARVRQMRQFAKAAKAAGIDVKKYLANGGTMQGLIAYARGA